MKFVNSIWYKRQDTLIYSAVQVDAKEVTYPTPNSIRALATCRWIRGRGDTLGYPTIHIDVTSPAPGIVGGVATHFKGPPALAVPRWELFPDGAPDSSGAKVSKATNDDGSGAITLTNDGINAVLKTQNETTQMFNLSYNTAEGKKLTALCLNSIQHIIAPGETSDFSYGPTATTTIADPYHVPSRGRQKLPYMSLNFNLDVGEKVYGLGERFGQLLRNGTTVDIWNEDGATSSPYAYKNVPFYFTNRGYGVFFDHSELVSMEIQTEKLSKVQVSVQGEQIRWFVIQGSTPKDILDKFTYLTGRPVLPPSWTFGTYLSTSFLTSYDEKTVTTQLQGMKERGIPVSVFHFDCFWMKGHRWCGFEFDEENFPDPRAFLSRLHDRGLKVCVWINTYIGQNSSAFDEAAEKGYLIKRKDGTIWQSDSWQAGMGIVDLTNPGAVKWYEDHLERLLNLGVDTFKTDFGERIPWDDVVCYNGMDPAAVHNYYSHLYNSTVFKLIERVKGNGTGAIFARSASTGGQRYPVHWGGDSESSWTGMAEALRGGLSFGLSGFAFWSHDISGFMAEGHTSDVPDGDLYKRWVQFGLLSSHSRLHGSNTYRVPWLVDEEASTILSKFSKLKNSLMPYIWTESRQAVAKGTPLLRAMLLEFPEDPTCWMLDQQYMFGSSLLVAPIFNPEGEVTYYIPEGTWVGLFDGKSRVGPRWITETYDNFSLPVLVRQNSVVLIGKETDRADYDYAANLAVAVVGHVEDDSVLSADVSSDRLDSKITRVLVDTKTLQASTEDEHRSLDLEVKKLGHQGFHF